MEALNAIVDAVDEVEEEVVLCSSVSPPPDGTTSICYLGLQILVVKQLTSEIAKSIPKSGLRCASSHVVPVAIFFGQFHGLWTNYNF